jgi:hypothetical protein
MKRQKRSAVFGYTEGMRVFRFFLLTAFALSLQIPWAGAIPDFHTAAAARSWAEAQQRAGNDSEAAEAFEHEAEIRRATGDPEGAEVEMRRAHRLETDLALAIPGPIPLSKHLVKWEPNAGCYLGVQDGDGGSADDFEQSVRRHLALTYEYSAYGSPFPARWAADQAVQGRAIQIAWEPNNIQDVRDDAYLESWAEDAGRAEIPIFLRFGGEMNGAWTPWGHDPSMYRRAFRLVHDVMAKYAPNVAMVWAPNAVPTKNLDAYYPGDDVVDWVGISLYVVRFYDERRDQPAWQDHPLNLIAPIYQKYAARHPICIVEWGVSRRSHVENRNVDSFAADRIEDLFAAIKVRFPRLKMVCAYDRDNLSSPDVRQGRRLNDYSLPPATVAFAAYQDATSDSYFPTSVSAGGGAPYTYHRLNGRLPSDYSGPVAVSLATPSLDATLEVMCSGLSLNLDRPYAFVLPSNHGPVTLRVRNPLGRIAQTVTLPAGAQ